MTEAVGRWEYYFIFAKIDPQGVWFCQIGDHEVLLTEFFATLGDEGWELVGPPTIAESAHGSFTFIFKRPKG